MLQTRRAYPLFFLVLCLWLTLALSGQEKTYDFQKGMTLEYTLDLDTELHADLDHPERYFPLESHFTLLFYVLDRNERGEALMAAVSRLDRTTLLEAVGPKRDAAMEKSLRQWTGSLQKEDFAGLVLDPHGRLVKGRFPWPEAPCHLLPRILEGLALPGGAPSVGNLERFSILNIFQNVESVGEEVYEIYGSRNADLETSLRLDVSRLVPYRLEARYTYMTIRSIFEEKLDLVQARPPRQEERPVFFQDEMMSAAILQAALLWRKHDLDREFVLKALSSAKNRPRLVAARYLVSAGIPEGLDLESLRNDKSESLRFNLAKAEFFHRQDRQGIERFLHEGSAEIRARARGLLDRQADNPPPEEVLSLLDQENPDLSSFSEKDVYRAARARLAPAPDIAHFGPKIQTLPAHRSWSQSFRYDVYVPEDYDPRERWPVLINLAGGNGFSESQFLATKDIVPENYILVSPNPDYQYWWEPSRDLMFSDLLAEIMRRYAVDPGRLYLQGFSNGGIGAYHYAFVHPDRFASVASLMGYARSEGSEETVETEMSLNLKNTPLLIIHGAQDRVILAQSDRILAEFLRRNDIPHKYMELEREGHTITFNSHHQEILGFFRKYTRNPEPEVVWLSMANAGPHRNHWVRVEEKADPSRRAQIKARRKGAQFIIQARNVRRFSLLLNDRHYDGDSEQEVIVNGRTLFQGRLKLDPRALAECLRKESDPGRLYGVRLSFTLE